MDFLADTVFEVHYLPLLRKDLPDDSLDGFIGLNEGFLRTGQVLGGFAGVTHAAPLITD